MKYISLNEQTQIPIIGSGTNTFGKVGRQYQAPLNHDTSEIISAISLGYRHFDTAVSYRNESVLGLAIEESVVPREDLFITSKIPTREPYLESNAMIHEVIQGSLEALQTDYIDLYLIHKPTNNMDEMLNLWHILEEYYEKGTFKAIGVSNFHEAQLQYLIEHATTPPMVNQIESHPGHWQDDLIAFCQQRGIVVEAWGPLTNISDEAKDVLQDIGAKHEKSWAQIALKYQIQRDVVVIPKSHNPENQAANLLLFDFELTPEEIERISVL